MLHRRVVTMAGDGEPARDGRHVDDRSASPFTHAGKHRLGHANGPEVVRLQQTLGPVHGNVLDGARRPRCRHLLTSTSTRADRWSTSPTPRFTDAGSSTSSPTGW